MSKGDGVMADQGQPAPVKPAGALGRTRADRRRAQTRRALIRAGCRILADRGPEDVSIQQITDLADVGFGTFYNHFQTKAELFDAAVSDTLEEYGQLLDGSTAGIDDPAEVFAVNVRLTGRLAEARPQMARILLRSGLDYIRAENGLAPRALRDIKHAVAAGRFQVSDPWISLAAVAGSLLGLVEMTVKGADLIGPDACEHMAEIILRQLGMGLDEAHEIARRPLPEFPPSEASPAPAP